jgi:phage terminase large subunit-like protein
MKITKTKKKKKNKMENFNELKALVANMEEDVTKFYDKDNKAAGVRVRKTLQEIKGLAQTMRVEVSDKNKG